MTTRIGQADGQCQLTGQPPPTIYASSDHATRGFWPACGTPMVYQSTRWPQERHVYAALLTDPGAVTLTTQYHSAETLASIPAALTLTRT